MGAAVLTDTGEIFTGCNVENASLGLTICAERNAIFQAVSHGHRKIRAILVITDGPSPASPCGACRQVINEFGPEAGVWSCSVAGETIAAKVVVFSSADLARLKQEPWSDVVRKVIRDSGIQSLQPLVDPDGIRDCGGFPSPFSQASTGRLRSMV